MQLPMGIEWKESDLISTVMVGDNGTFYSKRYKKIINGTITGKKGQKYLTVSYRSNGKVKHYKAHRLVANCFIPNPENKPTVNHKDGNKLNNHKDNLEWCTMLENNVHAIKYGLRRSIKVTGVTSIKKINVNEMYFLRASGINQKELASIFNVNQSSISRILKNYKS